MAEYLSTFVSGFEPLVSELMPDALPGARLIRVSGGLALYRYNGNSSNLDRLGLFGNTFQVLRSFGSEGFPAMVRAASSGCADFRPFTRPGQSFRVRFHQNGRFEKVDPATAQAAERAVMQLARLRVDRLRPDVEFWYIRRTDQTGYYALLIHRRAATERELQKGELRPELARGMCLLAGLKDDDVLLDPFSGSGATVEQALSMARLSRALASDIDEALVQQLSERLHGKASVCRADARFLRHLPDHCVDAIVTDPPWGLYDRAQAAELMALYQDAFAEFKRVLRPNGRLVVLSAAPNAVEIAADAAGFATVRRLNILVNGKKAELFRLTPIRRDPA